MFTSRLAFEQSNDFPIRFCTNDKIYNHKTSIARRQLYFQSIGQAMKGFQRARGIIFFITTRPKVSRCCSGQELHD